MKCSKCGGETFVVSGKLLEDWTVERSRRCQDGHTFLTREVVTPAFCKQHAVIAKQAIEKRVAIYHRNLRILSLLDKGLEGRVVAQMLGVSPSTVSLVKRAQDD